MNFLTKINLRIKLLLLLFIPLVLFLFFSAVYINGLIDNARTVVWNRSLRAAINPFDELNEAVASESLYSSDYIIGGNKEKLTKARLKTDQAVLSFQNQIKEARESFSSTVIYGDRILSMLDSLYEIREKIDAKNFTFSESYQYFLSVVDECFVAIAELNRFYKSQVYYITRHNAYLYLLREQYASQRVNSVITLALQNNLLTSTQLAELTAFEKAKAIYHSSFLNFASSNQITAYKEYLSGSISSRAHQIIKSVLQKGMQGGYQYDLADWIVVQEREAELYDRAVVAIKELLAKKSEASVRNSLIKLCVVAGVVIIVFLGILWLGWGISKDTMGVIENLKSYTSNVEKKDLSIMFEPSGRRDEFDGLERSVASMGQSLQNILFGLKNESGSIMEASSNIVNTVSELASCQKELESVVVETNATMEELRQTSEHSNKKAQEVLGFAESVLQVLESCRQTVQVTINNLSQIQEKIGVVTDSTTKLNDHCQAISSIIDSVHDIAEQSHVLAVNASIEAAKAGDHGKGFAVVAQEMQNLAEQSKQATQKVHGILTDIQNAMNTTVLAAEQGSASVKKGVEQSSDVTNAVNDLSGKLDIVSSASKEISSSSEQQLNAVNQTNTAIANIKTAAQQQGEQTRKIEESVTNLHKISETLSGIVHEFRLPEENAAQLTDQKGNTKSSSPHPSQET